MNEKVMIRSTRDSNLLKAIIDYMETEKIEYVVDSSLDEYKKDYKIVIYMIEEDENLTIEEWKGLSVIVISNKKKIIATKSTINYLITNLITDQTNYTDVQKEYLFKKGIYHIFLEKLGELLENENNYNGMIYDLTELKTIPNNWIFHFDSINDTYSWLSKKNAMLPSDFTRKVVNFYDDKVYDDSLREINYLTEKLMEIKDGKRKTNLKKVFPGYVLVKMIVTEESWYIVRNTRGVTGFVGSGTDPIPLTDDEIRNMGFDDVPVNIDYDVNDNVRVMNGPLENFIGVVQEINKEKNKVKVLVSMFGRETPVELEFSQVQKID